MHLCLLLKKLRYTQLSSVYLHQHLWWWAFFFILWCALKDEKKALAKKQQQKFRCAISCHFFSPLFFLFRLLDHQYQCFRCWVSSSFSPFLFRGVQLAGAGVCCCFRPGTTLVPRKKAHSGFFVYFLYIFSWFHFLNLNYRHFVFCCSLCFTLARMCHIAG